ncbi:toxic anion resistance protein [Mangrovibacillus cuniculi]|uniref:Toxic anion resistance protein n=1 Tax=Mangrovibacillus cuniculi TaxID=2593652 RepID=A0A7S8HFA2_9BACI|nr:toxic anion resistance protein [Mangrovibacillus cuniculi]QPC46552.1 toxic anion resistance protein [Mangrovibacillus cuniculi]
MTKNTFGDLLSQPFEAEEKNVLVNTPPTENSKNVFDSLPAEHQSKAKELSKQLNESSPQTLLTYGAQAQEKLSTFSHSMLNEVQKKDIGPIGDLLKDLMKRLQEVDPEAMGKSKGNWLSRLVGKVSVSTNELFSQYQKVGAQIDRISVKLEQSKGVLLQDANMLNGLYDENKAYFEAINVYIAAAELKLEELEQVTIPQLRRKVEQSDDQMLQQDLYDIQQYADRLGKRIFDLKTSRHITIQTAPQIRLIQNMNQSLAEKIQSSILTTIPLWKNQMTIALSLMRQQKALHAQKHVADTTNQLLLKNAEMLKVNSIETAKENERGIIDMETLKKTQEDLVLTIKETLAIQQSGRAKRLQAESELQHLENQLKQSLMLTQGQESKNENH